MSCKIYAIRVDETAQMFSHTRVDGELSGELGAILV